jgi:hypothetical protein
MSFLVLLTFLAADLTGSSLLAEDPAPSRLLAFLEPTPEVPPAPLPLPPVVLANPLTADFPLSEPLRLNEAFLLASGVELAPEAPPAPVTKDQHLRAAIRHLREAGFEEQARQIEQQAQQLQAQQHRRLQEKRRQLEQLQCEIADLEQELGMASIYSLDCIMAEVSLTKCKALGLTMEMPPGVRRDVTEFLRPGTHVRSQPETAALFAILRTSELLRNESRPTLISPAERPAVIQSGGEFPVCIPGQGSKSETIWRHYGVRLEGVVHPLGGNRLRIDVAPEHSERDFSHVVRINGEQVPAITSRSANFAAELNLGDTVLASLVSSRDGEEIAWIVAITPQAVQTAPLPLAEEARLQPIPEAEAFAR